jgi:hypothetical protein
MSKAVDVLLMKSFECVLQEGGEDALAKVMLNHLARVSGWAASQLGADRTMAMLAHAQHLLEGVNAADDDGARAIVEEAERWERLASDGRLEVVHWSAW